MIRYQFFPRSHGITEHIKAVIDAFKSIETEVDSGAKCLSSNAVLQKIGPYLTKLKFRVETGKGANEKINVPVLFGLDNTVDKKFFVDALSEDGKIVVEIEAGQALENHRFLKDIFEACMMFGVEYLILAVRNRYRSHQDFDRIYTFLETMYLSNRIKLPLSGILLIGY